MRYQIKSKDGTVYGIYEGSTREAAFAAMVADAGGPATDSDDKPLEGTADDWTITPVPDSERI